MALDLTQTPLTLQGRPVKKLIKLPPELKFNGKRVIKIRADQLIDMKKDNKFIIHSEKIANESADFTVNTKCLHQVQLKREEPKRIRIEVLRNENATEDDTRITSSFFDEPSLSDSLAEYGPVTEQQSELYRIKRELKEAKLQVKYLQEQYLKKEKEAFEYKRLLQLMNHKT